jgi:hypothetical protein
MTTSTSTRIGVSRGVSRPLRGNTVGNACGAKSETPVGTERKRVGNASEAVPGSGAFPAPSKEGSGNARPQGEAPPGRTASRPLARACSHYEYRYPFELPMEGNKSRLRRVGVLSATPTA